MPLLVHADGWWIIADRQLSYEVRLHPRALDADCPFELLAPNRLPARRLAVVDAEVWGLYSPRIAARLDRLGGHYAVHKIIASETSKTRATVDEIHRTAVGMGLGRRDKFLAIGGGIVLSFVGLAAAELRKGMPYVAIPTTLVGHVDAALGTNEQSINSARRTSWGPSVAYSPWCQSR